MADEVAWIAHLKDLRARHGVGILEAERLALSDARWRRWVLRQINSDASCRKYARRHIRSNGDAALLYEDGDELKIR